VHKKIQRIKMTVRKTQIINGIEYVFLETSFWNSEKKRPEHKRKYIGKNIDGKFVPNNVYKLEMEMKDKDMKKGPKTTTVCVRKFFGASYLLD